MTEPHCPWDGVVNVVIVCALEVEYEALRVALLRDSTGEHDRRLSLDHFIAPAVMGLDILVVRVPSPGAGNVISGLVTSQMLYAYDPDVVFSFGIAGTLRPSDVRLNDVVYSTNVQYVDLRKDLGPEYSVTKRLPEVSVDEALLRILDRLRRASVGEGEFGVHAVLIASSEAVIKADNAQHRTLIKEALADSSVVEMESYGVMRSVELSAFLGNPPLAVAVKGISDDATSNKTDDLHSSAARNAAGFISEVLHDAEFQQLVRERQFRPSVGPILRQPRRYRVVRRERESLSVAMAPVVPEDSIEAAMSALSIALGISRRPTVAYHWRLTCMGIHLVDLAILRVMRALQIRAFLFGA